MSQPRLRIMLAGPPGSGKSILASLLRDFLKEQCLSGDVTISDSPTITPQFAALARRVKLEAFRDQTVTITVRGARKQGKKR